ncbi:glycine--tRNA ligase subunit beta, partial [Wolbachia endosymbiont of Pentidionis agamae]|uniref:glycine--tRNA ligase subunit beta n=1 Tax=Wolbachia endosymbiont of Pentidionis agamae TaxID=3110435 RepID=UPI002FD5470C
MLSQLLFECISEEIPPSMHGFIITHVKNYVSNILKNNNIGFESIEVFITAIRITFFVDKINFLNLESSNEIKGP